MKVDRSLNTHKPSWKDDNKLQELKRWDDEQLNLREGREAEE